MRSNRESQSFAEVADFVRVWARIPTKLTISPETRFERDLGITGDDGVELLQASEKRFQVNFGSDESSFRALFGLSPNEYLFNPEGWSIGSGGSNIITLFTNTNPSVKVFTVGQLHDVIRSSKIEASE